MTTTPSPEATEPLVERAKELLARSFERSGEQECANGVRRGKTPGHGTPLWMDQALSAICAALSSSISNAAKQAVDARFKSWNEICGNSAAIVACGNAWREVAKSIGCDLHGFNDGADASFITPDGDIISVGPKLRDILVALTPTPTEDSGEVVQADREAAASLIEAYWSGSDDSMMKLAKSYRAGHSQGVFARAFRDHRVKFARLAARQSPDSGMVETFASIIEWGDATFGPAEPNRIIARAGEEWREMIAPDADVPIEAADVIIVLLRMPGIAEAIQRKMAINRAREWKLMGDGTGYHVPKSPSAGEEA